MEAFKKVKSSFSKQKVLALLGAKLIEVLSGFCKIELKYSEDLTQQNFYFPAGVISTLADAAGGYAAYTLMQSDDSVIDRRI